MKKVTNLAFKGGGALGMAYVGAILELFENGMIKDVRRIVGTSAGSITGLILSLSNDPVEITHITRSLDLSSFTDNDFGVIRDTYSFVSKFGWYRGKVMEEWLKKQIAYLTGNENCTFKQLAEMKDRREFFCYITNVSTMTSFIASADTTPDLPLWKAVRASSSIPFFFDPVVHEQNGVKEYWIDGFAGGDYPVKAFDTEKYTSNRLKGHLFNDETLGFYLYTMSEAKIEKTGRARVRNIKDYASVVLRSMIKMMNKPHISGADESRTVFINCGNANWSDFNMSDDEKLFLINQGKESTKKFFDKKQ